MKIPARIERTENEIVAVIETRTIAGRITLSREGFDRLQDGNEIEVEILTDRERLSMTRTGSH